LLTSGVCLAETSATIISSTDYGKDTDNNVLYDSLIVEASIDVKEAMIFTIEGSLYSGEDLIVRTYKSDFLNEGINKVEINFEGKRIRESNLDGPYTLVVVLYDKHRGQVSKMTFETSFYSYKDFEN
jgi:hypothetical protein